jgi:regulator of sirC expression with transglutaminase-like and TPR domain
MMGDTPDIPGRDEIEAALRRVGARPDDAMELAPTALLLAALDRPRVALGRYRDHLAELAHDTADAATVGDDKTIAGRIRALNDTLVAKHGYAGDDLTYDDLQNANLMRVIDRRRGLPVALGILYIHAARAQGWEVAGLHFPGHFMIRLDLGGERAVLDPFNGGVERDVPELRALLKAAAGAEAELRPEHYAPASNREVLLRLQNNLKLRLLKSGDAERALAVIERTLLFAPGCIDLWREAALVHAHLDNLGAAVGALERFLDLSEDGQARHRAATLLQQIKARLH